MTDLATEMTNSTDKDGQTVITGTWDHNGNKIVLDAASTTSITADTNNLIDFEISSVDAIKFGWQSVADTGFVSIDPAAFTADTTENTHRLALLASNAITIPTGTTALVSGLYVAEPNITATGTVTDAATVYIAGAPTEGASNYSLLIGSGNLGLGTLTLGSGSITDSSGAIDFGNEALSTTGSISGAAGTFTGVLTAVSGSSGATPQATVDDFVVEGSGDVGLSILGGAANNLGIAFGDTNSNTYALIRRASTGDFVVSTRFTGASLDLRSGNDAPNLALSGDVGSQLATFAGDVTLSAGDLTLSSGNASITGTLGCTGIFTLGTTNGTIASGGTGKINIHGLQIFGASHATQASSLAIAGGLGVWGEGAQAQAAHIADATDLATALTAINALLAVIENIGHIAKS